MKKTDNVSVDVVMKPGELESIAAPILNLMNELQQKHGHSIDKVITTMAYVLGSAIAQRGCVIDLYSTINTAISPLADGYRSFKPELIS